MVNENLRQVIEKKFIDHLRQGAARYGGKIFSASADGKISADRNVFNKIFDNINSAWIGKEEGKSDLLDIDEILYLVFINEIEEKTTSIWKEDRNHYRSAVVTEDYLISIYSEETSGLMKRDDKINILHWSRTDHCEISQLKDTDNNFYKTFRFFESGTTYSLDIPIDRFAANDKNSVDLLLNLFNQLISFSKDSLNSSLKEYEDLKLKINNDIEAGNFNETISLLNIFGENYNISDLEYDCANFYYHKYARALAGLKDFKKAIHQLDTYISIADREEMVTPHSHRLKADILTASENHLQANKCYAYAEEHFDELETKRELASLKNYSYSQLKSSFKNLDYNKRKLIFTGNDVLSTSTDTLVSLKKNELPDDIHFPIGHPHVNEVYSCHPHRHNFYLPLQDFQQELFYDRVNEFTYILQCLGATKIEISSTKTNEASRNQNLNENTNVGAGFGINELKVDHELEEKTREINDSKLTVEKVQNFKPTKKPYIPEDVIWFKTDMNWQRFADQRLKGNISNHTEKITSVQSNFVSKQEMRSINVELQVLLPKVNVEHKKDINFEANNRLSFEQIITVEFEDVANLKESEKLESFVAGSDGKFDEYREEVKFMLDDDGIIDDGERRILDRKGFKLGLSDQEMTDIENEVLFSNYDENEVKYIEEIKAFLADGVISDMELMILDRYASRYKISDARKLIINNSFIKNN